MILKSYNFLDSVFTVIKVLSCFLFSKSNKTTRKKIRMEQKIERLVSLAQKCYKSFVVTQSDSELRPYLIKGTLPILYFGDIEAYFKSRYKIITTAINPSCGEFYYDKTNRQISYDRFPQFERIAKANTLNNENSCNIYPH